MTKYRWNKEELLKEREFLACCKNNQPVSLRLYDDMFEFIEPKEYIDEEFAGYKKILNDYEKININIQELKQIEEIADEVVKLPVFTSQYPEKINISENDLIALANEFFSKFDSTYSEKTLKILKRRNALHIDYSNPMAPRGTCFSINALEKIYIYLNRSKTLQDVITATHELSHGYDFLKMYNYLKTNNNIYDSNLLLDELLCEFNSTTIELLTSEFLIKEGFQKKHLDDIRRFDFNAIYTIFDTYTTNFKIIEFLNHNKKHIEEIEQSDIKSHLKRQGIIIDDPQKYLQIPLLSNIKYAYSYLIANQVNNNFNKKEIVNILNDVSMPDASPICQLRKNNVRTDTRYLVKEIKDCYRYLS